MDQFIFVGELYVYMHAKCKYAKCIVWEYIRQQNSFKKINLFIQEFITSEVFIFFC